MTDDSHASDIQLILSKRHHRDGDYWGTPDGKVYVGNPFSTITSLLMLYELGVGRDHEAVQGGLEMILGGWREDGKIKLGPRSPLYPCYTAEATRVLCRYGYADDERVRATMSYFMDAAHEGGGWRCNFTRFGNGPDTGCANPGATLYVLDALRFAWSGGDGADGGADEGDRDGAVVDRHVIDAAVDFLLEHWEIRRPLGPCKWGIGSLFMQVEFPFLRYNLFYWVYVLSFHERAREDARFRKALEALKGKLNDDGELVVERPHRNLSRLEFCKKGEPSALATKRHREIEANLAG